MKTLLLLLVKIHIDSKQEGVIYPCVKSEYAATREDNLSKHIKMKHDEVRYPCDKCGYAATKASNLQIHIKLKHQGVRHSSEN